MAFLEISVSESGRARVKYSHSTWGAGVGGGGSRTHRHHSLPDVPGGKQLRDHLLHGSELAQGAAGDQGDQVPEMMLIEEPEEAGTAT